MSSDLLINRARSSSTHVRGRALNSVGMHHFIIDGSSAPKEEITPPEAFLAAISSCAVHLLEQFADGSNIPLHRVEVGIEAVRQSADPSRFDHINMTFDVYGPNQE